MRYLVSVAAPASSMRLLCLIFFHSPFRCIYLHFRGESRKKHPRLFVAAEAVVFIYSNVFIHFHFSRTCVSATMFLSAGAEEITIHMWNFMRHAAEAQSNSVR